MNLASRRNIHFLGSKHNRCGGYGSSALLKKPPGRMQPTVGTQIPQMRYGEIISAGQNIYRGTIITEPLSNSIYIPEGRLVQRLLTNKADLLDIYLPCPFDHPANPGWFYG